MSASNDYDPSIEVEGENFYVSKITKPKLKKTKSVVAVPKELSNNRAASVKSSISNPIERSKQVSKNTKKQLVSLPKSDVSESSVNLNNIVAKSDSVKRHAFSVTPITTYVSVSKFSPNQKLSQHIVWVITKNLYMLEVKVFC